MDTCEQAGKFSWFELMTSDVEGAQAFYGPLLGWQFEKNMDAGMEYTLVRVEGEPNPVAGMFDKAHAENSDQIPPHWGNYITVNDVDTSAARALELGGKVLLPPTDIPTVGRFCVIQDPQGAVVSLMTYSYERMA